jgi:hypothetical protein
VSITIDFGFIDEFDIDAYESMINDVIELLDESSCLEFDVEEF